MFQLNGAAYKSRPMSIDIIRTFFFDAAVLCFRVLPSYIVWFTKKHEEGFARLLFAMWEFLNSSLYGSRCQLLKGSTTVLLTSTSHSEQTASPATSGVRYSWIRTGLIQDFCMTKTASILGRFALQHYSTYKLPFESLAQAKKTIKLTGTGLTMESSQRCCYAGKLLSAKVCTPPALTHYSYSCRCAMQSLFPTTFILALVIRLTAQKVNNDVADFFWQGSVSLPCLSLFYVYYCNTESPGCRVRAISLGQFILCTALISTFHFHISD